MKDFNKHNEEVQKVWDAYKSGNPLRVHVFSILGL